MAGMPYSAPPGHNRRMSQIRRGSLTDPSVMRPLARGEGSLVRIGPLVIGRALLQPGWRWSVDIKPIVGTASCQSHHLHILTAGRFAVEMDDGERAEFGPGDVFDIPPGHDTWVVGDEPAEVYDVSGNVAEFGTPHGQTRVVATLLMTDIVDSTPTAARLGDAAWKQLLADHDRLVRHELTRFRGQEVDTTGDGFLATFASAGSALQCAAAICRSVRELGLQVRIGVHTGEIEVLDDGIRGIAVHTVARVMASARPSEVLTTLVTRALSEGGGLAFSDRGRHELKGIPAPVELFALQASTGT